MPDAIRDKAIVLRGFQQRYSFALDPFQAESIDALAEGRSVMVAAPTGTGKTVVAEFAVYLAHLRGQRVMYTTPIKALSNQKFHDFRDTYGDDAGLLTGDVVENRTGHIIVMTTEVLRNMMLQTPHELDDVGVVIFDEVHYIADPERGTVWEEAIVLAPKHLQFVCLSATVTNAAEIAAWISAVHRPVQLIEHFERAVPLLHYYYLDNSLQLVLDEERRVVADFPNVGGEARRRVRSGWSVGEDDRRPAAARPEPDPTEILQALQRQDMLPAIYFLFSRRDCEAAADVCAMMRLRLVRDGQRIREIGQIVESHLSRLSPEDRALSQVKVIARLAHRGFGFHHAGLLPVLKQLVEELFTKGLMGVVFATDTLALGINMPARTVVVGRMSKFDGQSRRPLIPNEFQQMAGRAGRRGIDETGYVVIPYSPWVPFREAMDIAVGPLHPVQSGFNLRYNAVINLWDPPRGARVLQMQRNSLMQFQMAHQTRALAETVQQCQRRIDAAPQGCLIGHEHGETLLADHDALSRTKAELRHEQEQLEHKEERLADHLNARPWQRPTRDQLRRAFRDMPVGALVHVEDEGWAVFLGALAGRGPGLLLIGDRLEHVGNYQRIDFLPDLPIAVDLPVALQGLAGEISGRQLPALSAIVSSDELARLSGAVAASPVPDLDAWYADFRAEVAAKSAQELAPVQERLDRTQAALHELQLRLDRHVCERCPVLKKHRRNLREVARLMAAKAEAEGAWEAQISYEDSRAQRTLSAIASVLHQFGYLKDGFATDKAGYLANVFDGNGLLICEAFASGLLSDLRPEDLAEVFSWFAYDRDLEFVNRYMLPHHLVRLRRHLDELQAAILTAERRNDLMQTFGYNYYFFGAARAWCRRATLEDILSKVNLGEGDLVMTFNKTIDLLRQVQEMLGKVAPHDPLREQAQQAQRLMRRGIVEQTLALGIAPGNLGDAIRL
jgi:ATP-dependent RNA helicase HelY